ncbi:MAG: hydroxymethylbilane synthase [Rhodospirillaceae bacterium]|nr:hydroxymethylbilane synthase [Rhodospirillaceae bacterium]|tara:strand:- start:7902 stop:8834 length:933 start_codon:yes stop_codon:yes gene_type:complete
MIEKNKKLRIATRGSPLALAQANEAANLISKVNKHYLVKNITIKTYRTQGDRLQTGNLSKIGGKGLFTKEVEQALLRGDADIAVHSMKDMPIVSPNGLIIAAYLPRADCRDVLIGNAKSIEDLPIGARVGSASVRRQAILKSIRPDLIIETIRGNVNTRIDRVINGDFDATLLAAAGIARLGMRNLKSVIISIDDILPAVCQGIIGVQCRETDHETIQTLKDIDDETTRIMATTERAFLSELGGSCKTPIAGCALVEKDRISLRGMIIRPDGTEMIAAEKFGSVLDPDALGAEVGRQLRRGAGEGFFDEI